MQQSVKLLHVNDPLFKRMGASRLASFAIDGNAFHLHFPNASIMYNKPR